MNVAYGVGPVVVVALALLPWHRTTARLIAGWVIAVMIGTVAAALGGLQHGDGRSVLLLMVNGLAATSAVDTLWFFAEHPTIRRTRYYVWWALFWGALLTIALATNLIMSWIAIEFSTLASGALVVEMGNRRALEAAWKYIVIASVGLALALIGMIFVYAGLKYQGLGWHTLSYAHLAQNSLHIPLVVRQIATVFIVSGIATKVGLVPFHTWLPDAHAEAPSPVSGLLSGALLGLCLVTIERFVRAVAAPGLLSGAHLLILYGALSVSVGSLALFVQRDIKRLLAYSSIEQVGIMAIGLGVGTPLAMLAAWLQLVFHAVVKSSLFYLSGHLAARYHTKRLEKITEMGSRYPALAIGWAVGMLALAGVPPLGLAYSEWLLVEALWTAHQVGLIVIVGLALMVAFAALLYHLMENLWGALSLARPDPRDSETATLASRGDRV
jgi:hydrogenase-4 component F